MPDPNPNRAKGEAALNGLIQKTLKDLLKQNPNLRVASENVIHLAKVQGEETFAVGTIFPTRKHIEFVDESGGNAGEFWPLIDTLRKEGFETNLK